MCSAAGKKFTFALRFNGCPMAFQIVSQQLFKLLFLISLNDRQLLPLWLPTLSLISFMLVIPVERFRAGVKHFAFLVEEKKKKKKKKKKKSNFLIL